MNYSVWQSIRLSIYKKGGLKLIYVKSYNRKGDFDTSVYQQQILKLSNGIIGHVTCLSKHLLLPKKDIKMYFRLWYILQHLRKRHLKLIYYSLKQVPVIMDKGCYHYMKVCFWKSEVIFQHFYHIEFLESLRLESFCVCVRVGLCEFGGTFENFKKKLNMNLREMESKCRDLFCLINNFFWKQLLV